MRHARDEALDALEPLLRELRNVDGLKERTRGSFYRKGGGFLHFHEDPAGLFADLKVDGVWERHPVDTAAQRTSLLARARSV